MSSLTFKYDYQNNTLAYQQNELWYQISEEQQFSGRFGGLGFKLSQSWLSFNVYAKKIRVFAKLSSHSVKALSPVTYYRQDLPKECPVTFAFNETDELTQVNGKWIKQGGQHA